MGGAGDSYMAKTFILGIGAQRTGSTWLHSQIKKNKQINMGLCKEHHVFDVLFTPYFPKHKDKLLENIKIAKENGSDYKNGTKLLSFIDNPENYFDYFDRLYQQRWHTKAVGDMTPSYSMLDVQAFQFIRAGLEKRGFHIKVVFMMRDPVERIWSMIHQASKVKEFQEHSSPHQMRQIGMSNFINPGASMRTRYDRTITELEQVFSKQDIFYGFYENFFNSVSYAKLGDFLDINLKTPSFDIVRNSSLMKEPIQPSLAAEAAEHYASTYNFVYNKFGAQVRDLWPGFQYLDPS